MFGRGVPWCNAEWKLIFKSRRPPIAALVFGEVDAAVVPGIAVTAVAGFHRHQRRSRCVGRGMLKERAGRTILVFTAIEKRGDGRNASRFAKSVEQGATLADIISEGGPGGRVGSKRRRRMLQQFGVEEGKGVLERVGLGPWNRTLDRGGV